MAASEDDEDARIRQVVEQSRQQVIETDRKRAREHAIQSRGEQRRKIHDDQPRHQRRGPHSGQAGTSGHGGDGKSRISAPRAVRGIPASMIVTREAVETGAELRFAPGEIQREEQARLAAHQRATAYESRLPELPTMAHIEDFDAVSGAFTGGGAFKATGKALPPVAGSSAEAEVRLPLLPPVQASLTGALPALSDSHVAEDVDSKLFLHISFYLQCKRFLPRGTPEQHWKALGLPQQLSRQQWNDFVADRGASVV